MTTTETPPSEPEEARGDDAHGAAGDDFHDPEHDVDGLRTGVAVFGTLLLIVATIWVMSHLFSLMVQVERKAKIHDLEPKELIRIEKEQKTELAGKNADAGTRTIEQAIQALAKDK